MNYMQEKFSKNNILISIIMSVYNEPDEYIAKAIRSILNQTYIFFEFIIIIDNPENSDLIESVNRYALDERIKVILNKKNIGLANSLNEGIEIARGKYIARMDGDDISYLDRLEKEIGYLQKHPDCDMVCTQVIDIDENGEKVSRKQRIPKSDKALLKSLSYGSMIIHPSVMIKTDLIKKMGGYHNYYAAQDYDLWLRMRGNGCKIHFIKEPLLYYRRRKQSITNNHAAMQWLSTRYIRKYGNNFDENEYQDFIKKGMNRRNFEKHFNRMNSIKTKVNIYNLFEMFMLFVIDKECRIKLFNFALFSLFVEL